MGLWFDDPGPDPVCGRPYAHHAAHLRARFVPRVWARDHGYKIFSTDGFSLAGPCDIAGALPGTARPRIRCLESAEAVQAHHR